LTRKWPTRERSWGCDFYLRGLLKTIRTTALDAQDGAPFLFNEV
jgi:hypothetical protein